LSTLRSCELPDLKAEGKRIRELERRSQASEDQSANAKQANDITAVQPGVNGISVDDLTDKKSVNSKCVDVNPNLTTTFSETAYDCFFMFDEEITLGLRGHARGRKRYAIGASG
jgi:hypothetical protein